VRRFPCPDCGGMAVETYSAVFSDDPEDPQDPECVWRIDWDSPCGYVYDGLSNEDVDALIEIREGGATIGWVSTISVPPWLRNEDSEDEEVYEEVEFGTLFQAMHASHDECRLLGAVQERLRRRT